MRQAGVLAAAGIVALDTMIARMKDDHRRAQHLAQGLAQIPGLVLDRGTPHTNMVFLNLEESFPLDAAEVEVRLAGCGVKVDATGPRRFRLVLHAWVEDASVEKAIAAFRQVIQDGMI
jgi:threonine aldolase